MSGDHDDEPVGYRRPPKKHRFKPGRSGNPKGRPKRPDLSLEAIMLKELEKMVVATEQG